MGDRRRPPATTPDAFVLEVLTEEPELSLAELGLRLQSLGHDATFVVVRSWVRDAVWRLVQEDKVRYTGTDRVALVEHLEGK